MTGLTSDSSSLNSDEKIRQALLETARRYFPDDSPSEKIRAFGEWAEAYQGSWIFVAQANAERLSEIGDCPRILFVRGNPRLLGQLAIAVVGTRRPSVYGVRAALDFSRGLAQRGLVVVSGLARGIDAAAHRGALDAEGETVAVLGHGLDRIYPVGHTSLSQEILARGGCLVSEYPPGVPPLQHHFPRRNRLISGLALGTLVVQAAEKSGSLITARHALEQNREVFVVPGYFDEPSFSGGHRLIQQGAKLVLSVDDIVDELVLQSSFPWAPQAKFQSEAPADSKVTEPADTMVKLHRLFESGGDAVSLEWLREHDVPLSTITEALAQRRILELFPQHFVWAGK